MQKYNILSEKSLVVQSMATPLLIMKNACHPETIFLCN